MSVEDRQYWAERDQLLDRRASVISRLRHIEGKDYSAYKELIKTYSSGIVGVAIANHSELDLVERELIKYFLKNNSN